MKTLLTVGIIALLPVTVLVCVASADNTVTVLPGLSSPHKLHQDSHRKILQGPSPKDIGILKTLVNFNGPNGNGPYAALIQASDGNFYGITVFGGASNKGTVFRMKLDGTRKTLILDVQVFAS